MNIKQQLDLISQSLCRALLLKERTAKFLEEQKENTAVVVLAIVRLAQEEIGSSENFTTGEVPEICQAAARLLEEIATEIVKDIVRISSSTKTT